MERRIYLSCIKEVLKMSKATILDRLAGAMETLGKREGKALTPKQRVAAAQRWNSLADISENRLRETLYDYMPGWEANQYTRNYPNYEAMPPVKMMPGDDRTLDLDELNGFESFDEFPDNGWVDMPWKR